MRMRSWLLLTSCLVSLPAQAQMLGIPNTIPSNSILNIQPQASATTDFTSAINSIISKGGVAYLQWTGTPYLVSGTLTYGAGGSIVCDPNVSILVSTTATLLSSSISGGRLQNCKITYAGGVTPNSILALLSGDHFEWIDNTVISAGGIFVNGTNAFANKFTGGLYQQAIGTAISIQNGAYSNVVDGMEFENNVGFGIWSTLGSHSNMLRNNFTHGNGIELIGVTYDSYDNDIITNHVELTGDNCISVSGYANRVIGNKGYHCRFSGIDIYGNMNVVTGNSAVGNGQAHNPSSPYYDPSNMVSYPGIPISAGFGGAAQENVVTGNYIDDDQASPTQAYGWTLGAGYAAWVTNTVYPSGSFVYSNGNIYETPSGGTSGVTAPACTSGTCSDGGVTWTFKSVTPATTREASGNTVADNHVFRYLTAGYVDNTVNHNNTIITEGGFQYYGAGSGAINNTVQSGFQRKIGTNWSVGISVTFGELVYTNVGNTLYRVINAGGTTGAAQPSCSVGTTCTTADTINWLALNAGPLFTIDQVNQQNSGPGNILATPVLTATSPTNVLTFAGAGSPQNVVTAPVGSMYLRSDGSTGSTLYVKETGTGNTGWTAK